MKSIVLTTFGSYGDLHPYMALAKGLQARGHDVLLATSGLYREKVEAQGIPFHPVRPDLPEPGELEKIAARVYHPRRGTEYIIRELLLPHLRASYDDLTEAVRGASLLVSHAITYAAPLVAEQQKIRRALVILSPLIFMSKYDFPVLAPAPELRHVRRLGPGIIGLVFRMQRRMIRSWAKPIHDLRRELGLPPDAREPLLEGMFSSDLNLAMISRVLAVPQPDWPTNTRVTGFPMYDHDMVEDERMAALDRFLGGGPPPIVFTLGSSAVFAARDFYRHCVEAAKRLNRRAVLVVGRDERNRPAEPLPDSILAVEYAPYSRLFPKAAVNVHQGGVGTLAQALQAGRPMLVVPFAHDQPDNADRAVRLGVARSIPRGKFNAAAAVRALRPLLENPAYARRAEEIGRQVRAEDGVADACIAIEELLGNPA